MDTYSQDTTIPIYIILNYDGIYSLKFPINPESLKKDTPSPSSTQEVEGIGQVSIPKKSQLSKITIESFFWQQKNLLPSFMYVAWIEKWQKSEKPANLIVTRLNYSMQVTCENFTHWINACEEEDIYFILELQEYRPHGAKRIGKIDNPNLLQSLQQIKESATLPILFEVPRVTRSSVHKRTFTSPYTVKKRETLLSITKKITGSSKYWKLLYDENKKELGDIFMNSVKLKVGMKLKLPDEWVQNSNYNIVQEEL